jgi:hypothetical protein
MEPPQMNSASSFRTELMQTASQLNSVAPEWAKLPQKLPQSCRSHNPFPDTAA